MDNSIIEVMITTSSLVFIFVLQILMPKFTRKELCFGIRIPENEANCEEIKSINKNYIIHSLLICIPYLILYVIISYYFHNPIIIVIGTVLFLIVTSVPYLIAYKKVKKLKQQRQWGTGKKSVVVIDTKFSRDKKLLVSSWWFIIPAVIIMINIIIGLLFYPNIPDKVPTKWDMAGNVTVWQYKSYGLIFQIPLAQMVTLVLMFFSFKAIGWAKQQISVSNPEDSVKKNKAFRNAWAKCTITLAILYNVLFTFSNLAIIQIIHVSGRMISVVSGLCTLIIGIIIIVPLVRFGQGGSRMKSQDSSTISKDIIDRNDDQFWILGQIYYNPNDPAALVEKRFGVGWTFNMGSPRGILAVVGIFMFVLIAGVLSYVLTK